MKKLSVIVALMVLVTLGIIFLNPSPNEKRKPIVVAVFPVTVDAFVNFQKEANSVLAKANIDFIALSAEGDATRFGPILDIAIRKNPDVLVIVGTQLANIALSSRYSNFDKPIIASCISDPDKVDALVEIGIQPPRSRAVAILTDMPKNDAYSQSAEAISKAIPGIKKVGILFNKSEINSIHTANKLAASLREIDVTVLDGVVSGDDDVVRIASILIRNGAQLLAIPHDKYVIKKAAALSKMGKESSPKVPIFALDDGTVRKDGAAFGVSVDYGLLGAITADNATKIIQGNINPAELSVIQQQHASLVINEDVWSSLGMPALSSGSVLKLNPILIRK